jgi:signal transduction histidine kinase
MLDQSLEKILIISDEADTGRALKLLLESSGYAPSLVSDGHAAVTTLENDRNYSVAMLDLKTPELDNVTVLKQLKNIDDNLAVIVISGDDNVEMAVECMKCGADDYISRQSEQANILQTIDQARNRRTARIERQRIQQEKDDLILTISHDMKNPLTAVIGSIDIICEGCLGTINDEQKDYLHSAIDSCNEAVAMIDNLLDIRKFEAGNIRIVNKPYIARELINKIAGQYTRAARHDGIILTVDIEPGATNIAVDYKTFNRVLGNLLCNAIKFTQEGGSINISCGTFPKEQLAEQNIPAFITIPPGFAASDCFVKLSVRDTGNGMTPDEFERIFGFHSQSTPKTARELRGSGLGLTYCRLAINSFNGVIWGETEPEQWSKVIILLPCCSTNND